MKKKTIFTAIGSFVVALVVFGILTAGGFDDSKSGYLTESTNSSNTDTIRTAGDSADTSNEFINADANGNMFKYLIVEYIQAAAPIKELVVASPNIEGIRMTYDEADSTIKLWANRHLGWVQLGFYAQVTSTMTNTLALTTSANDTIAGTTTNASYDTLTAALTDQITVQSTGANANDSVRTITGTIMNDIEGTETHSIINDGSGTITGTETTTMTDPTKIIYELVVTPDSGTKTVVFAVRGTNYLVGY